MNKSNRAQWSLIASMVIFGTIGLFKQAIPVFPAELALYRAILATGVLGLTLLLTGQKIDLKAIRGQLPLLLLSGAAMGFNWILLFEAYERTSVSAATLSYYFAPVIVTVVSPLIFRERLTARQFVCFAVSTLGLVLMTGLTGLGESGSDLSGILFGLGAAVLYASVMLLNKRIHGVEGLHRTLVQFVAAIAALTPYVLCTCGVTLLSGKMDALAWVCLLIVGLVHTGLAYVMYFPALKELPGQKAAILSYIDPLVAVLVSVLLLHETMGPWQWVGGAMILGATLWNEMAPAKRAAG